MSYNTSSDDYSGSYDATSGRREGFNDNRGGVDSYGQGTGSGAYDPTNTGLGGYGTSNTGYTSNTQPMRTSAGGDFDDNSMGQSGRNTYGGGQGTYGSGGVGATGISSGDTDMYSSSGGSYGGIQSQDDSRFNKTDFSNCQSVDGGNLDCPHPRPHSPVYGDDSSFGERQGGKPTFGDKMRGQAQKLAGTISGDAEMKARGEQIKRGEL